MFPSFKSTLAALLLLACTTVPAGVLLQPSAAPEWEVSEWIHGAPGKLSDQQGKIVVIEFFQLWCPVSEEFSVPLFKRWEKRYAERNDLLLVSIHTVFEGFEEQTPERLRAFVQAKGILHPVGIDAKQAGSPFPVTMERFATGGTPHVAVVDRQGMLRFSHFGYFDPEPVEAFIDRLLEEKEGKNKPTQRAASSPDPPRGRRGPPPNPVPQPPPVVPEPPPVEPEPQPVEAEANPPEQQEEGQQEPAEAEPIEDFSGSYRLRVEQTAKSCGEVSPAQELIGQIAVSANGVEANLSRAHLGLRKIAGSYDAGSQHFSASLDEQANQGSAVVQVHVEVTGRFFEGPNGPELEFEFQFSQQGAEPESGCEVQGRGSGVSLRRR